MNRMVNFVVGASLIFILVAFGFWLGGQNDEGRAHALKMELESVEQQKEDTEAMLTDLRTEAQTATMRYEQLQQEINEQMPAGGPVEEIIALVRKQIEEGADPERLVFALRSARAPRNCAEPETRRFVVSTPAYKGADSEVSIADGAIVIKGSGVSSKNKDGAAEAWYDASKSVAMTFVSGDGVAQVKKGVMPLHHSVVAGAREYRFTIEEGAQSFAKVTFDSCDYP